MHESSLKVNSWPECVALLMPPLVLFSFPHFHILLHSQSLFLDFSFCLSAACFSAPSSSVHLHPFSVASSQANNQLINQLSPRIIVAALRGALKRLSRLWIYSFIKWTRVRYKSFEYNCQTTASAHVHVCWPWLESQWLNSSLMKTKSLFFASEVAIVLV